MGYKKNHEYLNYTIKEFCMSGSKSKSALFSIMVQLRCEECFIK